MKEYFVESKVACEKNTWMGSVIRSWEPKEYFIVLHSDSLLNITTMIVYSILLG